MKYEKFCAAGEQQTMLFATLLEIELSYRRGSLYAVLKTMF